MSSWATCTSGIEAEAGTQFETDSRSTWESVCANDPFPVLLPPYLDRRAYLTVIGCRTYQEHLSAIQDGVGRGDSLKSIANGLDAVRFPSETVVHAGETKSNPTSANLHGQRSLQLESMKRTGKLVEYELMVPTHKTVSEGLQEELNIVQVHKHPLEPSIAKVRQRKEMEARTARESDGTAAAFEDRPYQRETRDAALSALNRGDRVMKFQIPTNMGKSYIIGMIARDAPRKIALQIAITPHIRLCGELKHKIKAVVPSSQPVIELDMDQSYASSIESAVYSQVVQKLTDRSSILPIIVTTYATFRSTLRSLIREHADAPSLVFVDEAFAYTFDEPFADDLKDTEHVQWMLFSATLPVKIESVRAREAVVDAPMTYEIPHVDAIRMGRSLPVHFHLIDSALPFIQGAIHHLVAMGKKKVMVFSPSSSKALEAHREMEATLREYRLNASILDVISKEETKKRKHLKAFGQAAHRYDVQIMNAILIGRFGMDHPEVDAVVVNFRPSDANKLDAVQQLHQMAARVRVESGCPSAEVLMPELADFVIDYQTKYDPQDEFTRVSYVSSDPEVFFCTKALRTRESDTRVSALRHQQRRHERDAERAAALTKQDAFEARVRALLAQYRTIAPKQCAIVALAAAEGSVKASSIKTCLKDAKLKRNTFYVSESLQREIDECDWMREYLACDNTRATPNSTCENWTPEYDAGRATLDAVPFPVDEVLRLAETFMKDGSGLKDVKRDIPILLGGTGVITFPREDGRKESVNIPGLADMKLSDNLYTIRAAIKAAGSAERGGDTGHSNMHAAFGKIIIYQHYQMGHSACQGKYAAIREAVAKHRASRAAASPPSIADYFGPAAN